MTLCGPPCEQDFRCKSNFRFLTEVVKQMVALYFVANMYNTVAKKMHNRQSRVWEPLLSCPYVKIRENLGSCRYQIEGKRWGVFLKSLVVFDSWHTFGLRHLTLGYPHLVFRISILLYYILFCESPSTKSWDNQKRLLVRHLQFSNIRGDGMGC